MKHWQKYWIDFSNSQRKLITHDMKRTIWSLRQYKSLINLLKRVIKVNYAALLMLFTNNRRGNVKEQKINKINAYQSDLMHWFLRWLLSATLQNATLYTEPTKCIQPSTRANRYGNNANKPLWLTGTSIVYKRDGRCISPLYVNLIESDRNHQRS